MKNKTPIAFIVMLIGSFLSGYYGPWWAPAVFIVISAAILGIGTRQGLVLGACAVGIAFLAMALWMGTKDHEHIIEKTGTLLGGLSQGAMVGVTTFIGLVTGLLAGWLGSTLGALLKAERKAGVM